MKRAIIAVAAVLAGVAPSQARIITVDDDGPADFATIQAAIDDSNDGDTVLVADGTYTGDGNRDIDFHGKGITVKSQNGPENCIIDCNGSEAHKHRGFYFHSEEDACSSVIGFTITNGYPPGEDRLNWPPFTYAYLGGAIRCKDTSPAISHCIITGNRAKKGGGIHLGGGAPKVSNCTITDNYAVDWGGGIAISSSDAEISNCIIWGNSAPSSPQIYNAGSGSPTVAYSDVQGGWAGAGSIDADPCFVDPNEGDYHLKSQGGRWEPNETRWTTDQVTSPCIDTGNPMTPIGAEPFPNGGRINMGAYGGTAEASKSYFGEPPCEVIIAGDINGDCDVNFLDFMIMALHWLEGSSPGCAVTTTYLFQMDPNGLLTSGGLDGNGHGSYCIEGEFELTVDSCAGVAWFNRVDANIVCGESAYTVGLDALFHMSELISTDVNEAAIDFVFERNIPGFPGADVHLRVIFRCGPVQLVGSVCDAMCDGYCYHLDAVAVSEP